MNTKLAIKTLLRIINEHKTDQQQVVISSTECVEFKYRDPIHTSAAAEAAWGVDDIITIECEDAHIWFTIYAGNDAEELICDHLDNVDCNAIEEQYAEYFAEDEVEPTFEL